MPRILLPKIHGYVSIGVCSLNREKIGWQEDFGDNFGITKPHVKLEVTEAVAFCVESANTNILLQVVVIG